VKGKIILRFKVKATGSFWGVSRIDQAENWGFGVAKYGSEERR